jgi:two-component system, LytTR family, response regulator
MTHTNPLQCLIVDDEDLAVSLLENYVKQTEGIEVAGTCFHTVDARNFLAANKVDILFLDIQMPYLTGLELLKQLTNPPAVIFTTSYSAHAVEAFELSVLDYLLKPFAYERFLQAVEKAKQYINLQTAQQAADYFFVKSDGLQVKIMFNDVLYVEGLKQYVKIITVNGQVITLESMKRMEEHLPPSHFVRLHKSYIVCLKKITAMGRKEISIGNKQLPVGKTYEQEWVKQMKLMNT